MEVSDISIRKTSITLRYFNKIRFNLLWLNTSAIIQKIIIAYVLVDDKILKLISILLIIRKFQASKRCLLGVIVICRLKNLLYVIHPATGFHPVET